MYDRRPDTTTAKPQSQKNNFKNATAIATKTILSYIAFSVFSDFVIYVCMFYICLLGKMYIF